MQKYGLTFSDMMVFPKLLPMINSKSFRPKRQKELELSNQKATDLPPIKVLSIFPNLIEMDVSNNRIVRFDPERITKGCKRLRVLKMNNNLIKSLTDIKKLGDMEFLETLSFIGNPVESNLLYIKILGELLFPDRNKVQDQNEIFTATYTMIPNYLEKYKMPQIDQENIIYDEEVARMGIHKFTGNTKTVKHPGNKIRSLKWIFSVIDKKCPKRKIGKFKRLATLNSSDITIYDIYLVTNEKNKFEFITNDVEERTLKKMERIDRMNRDYKIRMGIKTKKVKKPKMNSYYYQKYKRAKKREVEKYEPVLYLRTKNNNFEKEDNYLTLIFKLDKLNARKERDRKKVQTGEEMRIWRKEVRELEKQNQIKIPLSQLKKERQDILMNKRIKEKKLKEGQENYKAFERRSNNMRKFKDKTNFDKLFSHIRAQYPIPESQIKSEEQVQKYLRYLHREARREKTLEEKKIDKEIEAMRKYFESNKRKPALTLVKFNKELVEESKDLENSELSEDDFDDDDLKAREERRLFDFRKKFENEFDEKTGKDYLVEVENIQSINRLKAFAQNLKGNSNIASYSTGEIDITNPDEVKRLAKLENTMHSFEKKISRSKEKTSQMKKKIAHAFKLHLKVNQEKIDKIVRSNRRNKLTDREKIKQMAKAGEELKAVFERKESVSYFQKKKIKGKIGMIGTAMTGSMKNSHFLKQDTINSSLMGEKSAGVGFTSYYSRTNGKRRATVKYSRSQTAVKNSNMRCFTPSRRDISQFLKADDRKKQKVSILLKKARLKKDKTSAKKNEEDLTVEKTLDGSQEEKRILEGYRKSRKAIKITENFLEESFDFKNDSDLAPKLGRVPRKRKKSLVIKRKKHKRNNSAYLENCKKNVKFNRMKKSASDANFKRRAATAGLVKSKFEKLVENKSKIKRARSLKKLADARKIDFAVYTRQDPISKAIVSNPSLKIP